MYYWPAVLVESVDEDVYTYDTIYIFIYNIHTGLVLEGASSE